MTTCSCGAGHSTYGACLRAKNLRISYCQSAKNFDKTRANNVERELAAYANARAQGIQPAGTTMGAVRAALDISDRIGAPYDAGSSVNPFEEQ